MKIRLANRIDENGLNLFDDSYEYCEDMTQEDAILVRSASLHDVDFPDSLLAIARAGAGVNNIIIYRSINARKKASLFSIRPVPMPMRSRN